MDEGALETRKHKLMMI